MTKRVISRSLDFKILILLALLGLSNLAVYDEVGGPAQECCELLESLITFDPDPVKICAGKEGTTVATFGESALWAFASAPKPKFFASRSIQSGPSTSSEIGHKAVNDLSFPYPNQKEVTVKIKATPVDPEESAETRWLSILLQSARVLSSDNFVGIPSGQGRFFMGDSNRIDFQFKVFCGRDFENPEPGPWTFSITETSSYLEGRFGANLRIPSAFQAALDPQRGFVVFQLVTPVQPDCNKFNCEARTIYRVTAQGGDPNRTVTNSISVASWVQPTPSVSRLSVPVEKAPTRVAWSHLLPSSLNPAL